MGLCRNLQLCTETYVELLQDIRLSEYQISLFQVRYLCYRERNLTSKGSYELHVTIWRTYIRDEIKYLDTGTIVLYTDILLIWRYVST